MAGFKQIKIFTDTNIIHAAQAHLLISTAVHKYVSEHKKIESVELKWFLPSMVLEERRHQMFNAALSLTPKLNEVERLLGHSLAITPEVMEDRITSKINKTIDELGLEVCQLDTTSVNWEEIIERSAHRHPPFEKSTEKEKGFRDAIIATTFLQEIERSPVTSRSCLLVFVSGDKRVREYIQEKTISANNVRVLETLDELKSFLNAIASEVTEEFLDNLYPKAKNIFHDFDKRDGLYMKENIPKLIAEQYSDELHSVTEGFPDSHRRPGTVTLGEQTFIKKTDQTVTWNTALSIDFNLVKYDLAKAKEASDGLLGKGISGGLLGLGAVEPTILASGRSQFSVEWKHQVTTTGKLIRPKINKVMFEEHLFNI